MQLIHLTSERGLNSEIFPKINGFLNQLLFSMLSVLLSYFLLLNGYHFLYSEGTSTAMQEMSKVVSKWLWRIIYRGTGIAL